MVAYVLAQSREPLPSVFLSVYFLVVGLVLLSEAAAVVMGLAGLVQKQRKRLFASIGVFIGVPVLALCCGTIVILSAPLNTPAANFDGPVAGPKPPKEVPRPPASSLHFGGQSVASAPTHWCKVIQSTMFCRGEEYIPLPPENKVLEAPAGAKLTFEFRGNERLRGVRGGPGPGFAPLYAGAERIGRDTETRPGPEGVRFVKPDTAPDRPLKDLKTRRAEATADGEDRFLVDTFLPPGEYVVRLVGSTPHLEAWYHFRVRIEPTTSENGASFLESE